MDSAAAGRAGRHNAGAADAGGRDAAADGVCSGHGAGALGQGGTWTAAEYDEEFVFGVWLSAAACAADVCLDWCVFSGAAGGAGVVGDGGAGAGDSVLHWRAVSGDGPG